MLELNLLQLSCSRCHKVKPATCFTSRKSRKRGFSYHCKSCYKLWNDEILENGIKRNLQHYYDNKQEYIDKAKRSYLSKTKSEHLLRGAKSRAKKNGLEFGLDLCDIEIPELCPVLGIPINLDAKNLYSDASPSLDRIDNTKGYTKDNVFVISRRANMIKNCGTANEHELIAIWMKKHGLV